MYIRTSKRQKLPRCESPQTSMLTQSSIRFNPLFSTKGKH
jgi:hypothetical protein